MKREVSLLFLLIFCTSQVVNSGSEPTSLSVDVILTPEPLFSQIIHNQIYNFNVSLTNIAHARAVNQSIYENNLTVILNIRWSGRGSYDFGDATAGYRSNLDQISYNLTINYPLNNQTKYVLFNHTFERDYFHFGIKPYEICEISVNIDLYQSSNTWTQEPDEKIKGEKITGWSNDYVLVDETKIRYSVGKLKDLRDELEFLEIIPNTRNINSMEYLDILEAMEFHVDEENFVQALEIWKDYEDKDRLNLLRSMIKETNSSLVNAMKTDEYLKEIDFWENSYELLEDKYVTLQSTYQTKLKELENTKQSLTTAITAVFLTSIIFFFTGRYSVNRKVLSVSQKTRE